MKKSKHQTNTWLTKKSIRPLALALGLGCANIASAEFQVHQVGQDNTLVRINNEKNRYLIIPVQESVPDAKVEVLVNGKVEDTFYVRLADSNIDYTVPYDLAPYAGKGEILLNITEVDRAHNQSALDFVCWDQLKTSDTIDTANKEKYRPAFHHTPLYGWMNDPNGMFYKDGRWHLYYQKNPYGSKWQNMTWGHSSSTDLVNWEHHDDAIRPDGLGTIFSGSSVVDHANTAGFGEDAVIALYTSAGRNQIQSMAYSLDNGMTFTKYPGNPVLPNPREARDPNMFWHAPTGQWVLVLADALEQQMQIYTSPDLKDWKYQSSFGKGYGSQAGVWECPDLMEIPVEGSNEKKWVLLCNINPGGPFGGSATQYFVGDFNGKKFTTKTPQSKEKWMDYGKDHYATVSWSNAPDNRHTVIGWMSNWEYANDVPTMQFRSANTLPRDLALFKDIDGEYYLSVKPSPEVEALRGEADVYPATDLSTSPITYKLPAANDGICEIVVDYDAKKCSSLDFTLSNDKGEKVVMAIDVKKGEFSMDRTESGITSFSTRFPAVTYATMHNKSGRGSLRVFVDRCSIEAFDGNGRFAMTDLVFPENPYTTLTVSADGGKAKLNNVAIYSLNSIN